ncbi:motile sperm domain-containing protein 2 [Galendromus occidentalis]|uniref:Motile sperm domain-containing protein 2 n=1 Tax=Galendromus occidentalis TaxID=34638 RepID=A0AAJ6QPK6_9ACAR|nr:motile sperm domain-containing protein 2 [Galendromus occidentalis]
MKGEHEQQVQEFRQKMENVINTNPTIFHPADVKRIQEDAAYCGRFLRMTKNDPDHAVEYAKKAFEWRKSMGVNDMSESTLKACRFLKSESLYPYGVTKSGAHILVMKARNHIKPKNAEEALEHRKLFAFVLDTLIKEKNVERVCLMMDCQNAGVSNVDMEGINFMISAFRDYYPAYLEQILVVDIPWVLKAVWTAIKRLLPREAQKIIHFVDAKHLSQYIEPDNLPISLNGTNDYCYKYVPGQALGLFCPKAQQLK